MKRIQYQLMTEINRGAEEEPIIEKVFSACEILCQDENLEANLAVAQTEAYNGEIFVEDADGAEL